MVDLFDVILMALATWRLSSLIVQEEGPYAIFPWIKYRIFNQQYYRSVGVKDETGKLINKREKLSWSERHNATEIVNNNEFLNALNCIWCTSIWIGLVITLAYSVFVVNLELFQWFLTWQAVSAGAILTNRHT